MFASDGFIKVTGYSRTDIIPRNCRFLQGKYTDIAAVKRLKVSIESKQESVELLLNYRKNGEPFWNLLYVGKLRFMQKLGSDRQGPLMRPFSALVRRRWQSGFLLGRTDQLLDNNPQLLRHSACLVHLRRAGRGQSSTVVTAVDTRQFDRPERFLQIFPNTQ